MYSSMPFGGNKNCDTVCSLKLSILVPVVTVTVEKSEKDTTQTSVPESKTLLGNLPEIPLSIFVGVPSESTLEVLLEISRAAPSRNSQKNPSIFLQAFHH